MPNAVQITRGKSILTVGPFVSQNKAQAWKEAFDMFCTAATSCARNVTTSICQVRRNELFDIEPFDRNESIEDIVNGLGDHFRWKREASIFQQNHTCDYVLVDEISRLSKGLNELMHTPEADLSTL